MPECPNKNTHAHTLYPALGLDCCCRSHHHDTPCWSLLTSTILHPSGPKVPGRTNRALRVQAVVNAHTHKHLVVGITTYTTDWCACDSSSRPVSSGPNIKGLVITFAAVLCSDGPWLVMFGVGFGVVAGMLALCYFCCAAKGRAGRGSSPT